MDDKERRLSEVEQERQQLQDRLDALVSGMALANAQLSHLARIQRTQNVQRAISQKQRANISQSELVESLGFMNGDELAEIFITSGRAN
jgi:hypothetical protein